MSKKTIQPSPQIDWLWAAVLERKMVFHYDLKDLAALAGISYEKMRRYICESPWLWPERVREKILQELGIRIVKEVVGQPGGTAE